MMVDLSGFCLHHQQDFVGFASRGLLDGPTMFPLGCINVDRNFDDVVRGDKVLTSLVEVACGVPFRRADGCTGFKVVGHRFILAHSFLKVGDLHVVNSGEVVGIRWILGWSGEGIPSSVEVVGIRYILGWFGEGIPSSVENSLGRMSY